MENNKPSGNDELFEVFYECFWDEIKQPFLASVHKAFLDKQLRSSQKQAGIKMLEKKAKIRDLLRTGGKYHCLLQI